MEKSPQKQPQTSVLGRPPDHNQSENHQRSTIRTTEQQEEQSVLENVLGRPESERQIEQ